MVVADALSERGMHEAGRVARLHPEIPVFMLTSDGAGTTGAIFDLLHPFQRALLVAGEVPEDSWTRVARHWHECYRLSHPPDAAEPADGDQPAMDRTGRFHPPGQHPAAAQHHDRGGGRGRRWVPRVARSRRQLHRADRARPGRRSREPSTPAGSSGGSPPGGRPAAPGRNRARDRKKAARAPGVNRRVVPWTALPAADRAAAIDYLRSQLAQLGGRRASCR